MQMINFTDPFNVFVATVVFTLVLWFSCKSKKSIIPGIMLFIFISILVMHTLELMLGKLVDVQLSIVIRSIIIDSVFVFLSFISYLWIDNIEAKLKKKKIINDSLDVFWKEL